MTPNDLNDSMPGLPPSPVTQKHPARFRHGEEVVCVDAAGCELVEGCSYVIDADYGDVVGKQMVYIEGYPDNCPFAATRFVRAAEYGMTQADKQGIKNVLTATDRGLPGPDASLQAGDEVNLPSHYARFKIEPIRFLVENFGPSILVGKIVKYSMRYDGKNGLQDIDKAIRCAQMLRAYVAGDPDWWQRKSSS